jgi:hypothetical protein
VAVVSSAQRKETLKRTLDKLSSYERKDLVKIVECGGSFYVADQDDVGAIVQPATSAHLQLLNWHDCPKITKALKFFDCTFPKWDEEGAQFSYHDVIAHLKMNKFERRPVFS